MSSVAPWMVVLFSFCCIICHVPCTSLHINNYLEVNWLSSVEVVRINTGAFLFVVNVAGLLPSVSFSNDKRENGC